MLMNTKYLVAANFPTRVRRLEPESIHVPNYQADIRATLSRCLVACGWGLECDRCVPVEAQDRARWLVFFRPKFIRPSFPPAL